MVQFTRRPAAGFLAILFGCLFFSCAGMDKQGEEAAETKAEVKAGGELERIFRRIPGNVRFVSDVTPVREAVAGVGLITRDQRDLASRLTDNEKENLAASFREAYTAGLIRGLPLQGVLGGDMVHNWPPAVPVTWVQNWQGSENSPNAWGIPSLVLAVRGLAHYKVFLVRGAILDAYGKSAGINGANGAAGYGAPCGDEFFYEGGIAQRFDRGLIVVDAAGIVSFVPEEPPSAAANFSGGGYAGDVSGNEAVDPVIDEAFQSVRKTALDRNFPPLESDSAPRYIDFSPEFLELSGGGEASISVRGIYYQSFGGARAVLFAAGYSLNGQFVQSAVLPAEETREVLPGGRVLLSPFLDVFLGAAETRAAGAESLTADSLPKGFRRSSANSLDQLLLDGILLYGIPLSDPIPRKGEDGAWHEVQRFSRGWMIND